MFSPFRFILLSIIAVLATVVLSSGNTGSLSPRVKAQTTQPGVLLPATIGAMRTVVPRTIPKAQVKLVELCPKGQGFCAKFPFVPSRPAYYSSYEAYAETRDQDGFSASAELQWAYDKKRGFFFCTNRYDVLCIGGGSGNATLQQSEEYEITVQRHVTYPLSDFVNQCADYPGGHGYFRRFTGVLAYWEFCKRDSLTYQMKHRGRYYTITIRTFRPQVTSHFGRAFWDSFRFSSG